MSRILLDLFFLLMKLLVGLIVWEPKYLLMLPKCPHMVIDVQSLDADFLVASSHKMGGPTGVGFLYDKRNLLSTIPPFLGGGEMIPDVFLDHSTYAEPPSRFEAGTPAIGEAIGLGAAINYLSNIGMRKIHDYEAYWRLWKLTHTLWFQELKWEHKRNWGKWI